MTTEEKRKIIENAGLSALVNMQNRSFSALLAYKHGNRASLQALRNEIAETLKEIDAALALYDKEDAKK